MSNNYYIGLTGVAKNPVNGHVCLKVRGWVRAGGHVVGWVAHVILVSAQVLLILTLRLWTLDFGLGLDNTCSRKFLYF